MRGGERRRETGRQGGMERQKGDGRHGHDSAAEWARCSCSEGKSSLSRGRKMHMECADRREVGRRSSTALWRRKRTQKEVEAASERMRIWRAMERSLKAFIIHKSRVITPQAAFTIGS